MLPAATLLDGRLIRWEAATPETATDAGYIPLPVLGPPRSHERRYQRPELIRRDRCCRSWRTPGHTGHRYSRSRSKARPCCDGRIVAAYCRSCQVPPSRCGTCDTTRRTRRRSPDEPGFLLWRCELVSVSALPARRSTSSPSTLRLPSEGRPFHERGSFRPGPVAPQAPRPSPPASS